MINKVLKVVLPLILTLGLLITGCSPESSIARVGEPAPDFELKTLDGESISLSDLKGQPVLINFWQTGCAPCVIEMPYLQEVYNEWSDQGLVLLAVNVAGNSSQVEEFAKTLNISIPVLLDTKGLVAVRYNIMYYPTTYFIDKDGVVQEKIVGAFPNKETIEKRVINLIP